MLKSDFHIRPRFSVTSPLSVAAICNRFKEELRKDTSPVDGNVREGYISLFPKLEDHHYWSPHLSVTVDIPDDSETTTLRGLYGPAPAVWTLFIFIYSVIGLAIVIISVIGFANVSLGESASILWTLPILILLFLSLYLTSYYGQMKGHDQIEVIDKYFKRILNQ